MEERWRFKDSIVAGSKSAGRLRPREHALLAEDPGALAGWPEVPAKLLEPSRWSTLFAVEVKKDKIAWPIHLKEGDAALLVPKHILRTGRNAARYRFLILGGNMSLALALGKGRCPGFAGNGLRYVWPGD